MYVNDESVGLEGSLTFTGPSRSQLMRRSDAIAGAVAAAARVPAAAVRLAFADLDGGAVRVTYALSATRSGARGAQERLASLDCGAVDAALAAAERGESAGAAPTPPAREGPYDPPRAALEAATSAADGARLRRPPRRIAVDEVACFSLSAVYGRCCLGRRYGDAVVARGVLPTDLRADALRAAGRRSCTLYPGAGGRRVFAQRAHRESGSPITLAPATYRWLADAVPAPWQLRGALALDDRELAHAFQSLFRRKDALPAARVTFGSVDASLWAGAPQCWNQSLVDATRWRAWEIFKPLYLAQIELVFHDS